MMCSKREEAQFLTILKENTYRETKLEIHYLKVLDNSIWHHLNLMKKLL